MFVFLKGFNYWIIPNTELQVNCEVELSTNPVRSLNAFSFWNVLLKNAACIFSVVNGTVETKGDKGMLLQYKINYTCLKLGELILNTVIQMV